MELKKGTTADTYINSAVTIIICFALSIFLFRLISVTPRSTHLKINNDNNDNNDNDNDNDSDNNNNNNRTLLKIVAYASNSSHDAKICHVSYNIRYLYFYPSKADTIGAKNTMSIIEKK